jgi:hypothetical protein
VKAPCAKAPCAEAPLAEAPFAEAPLAEAVGRDPLAGATPFVACAAPGVALFPADLACFAGGSVSFNGGLSGSDSGRPARLAGPALAPDEAAAARVAAAPPRVGVARSTGANGSSSRPNWTTIHSSDPDGSVSATTWPACPAICPADSVKTIRGLRPAESCSRIAPISVGVSPRVGAAMPDLRTPVWRFIPAQSRSDPATHGSWPVAIATIATLPPTKRGVSLRTPSEEGVNATPPGRLRAAIMTKSAQNRVDHDVNFMINARGRRRGVQIR